MQTTDAVLSHRTHAFHIGLTRKNRGESNKGGRAHQLHESVVDRNCLGARAAGRKTTARTFIAGGAFTLKVFRPMRTRICICTMLLAFCHVRMNAQTLTMRLPPAHSGIHLLLAVAAKTVRNLHDTQPEFSYIRIERYFTSAANLPDAPQSAIDNVPIAEPVPPPPIGVPVTIHARFQVRHGDTYDLRDSVEIDYEDYVILADHATYNTATGGIEADGHLQVTGGPDQEDFAADHGTLNVNEQTGHFYNVIGSVGVLHQRSRRQRFHRPRCLGSRRPATAVCIRPRIHS